MAEFAIVTSCDERYAPLAKGLILSLRAAGFPAEHQQICLLDIGCSEATRQWMTAQGVQLEKLRAEEHIPFKTDHLPKHITAMAFRPFMREVFPGFDVYLWIDSDTWVQQASSIHLFFHLATTGDASIAISPLIDVNYKLQFDAQKFQADLRAIYAAIYGGVGEDLSYQPILGAGVFAMHRDSQIWAAWAGQLPVVYRRDYSRLPAALHLAEQTALNRVVYSLGKPAFVEAIHNYHLCAGSAAWIDGQLCSGTVVWSGERLRHRPIGIAHLCSLSTYADKYVRAMAFFDRGRYLNDDELRSIARLRRQ